MDDRFANSWRRFWLARGHEGWSRKMTTRLAEWGTERGYGLPDLASLSPRGYIASSAELIDVDLRLGKHVFVGDRVLIARWRGVVRSVAGLSQQREQGFVELGDRARVERESDLEVFEGGYIRVGGDAIIQPCCVLLALLQPIEIGERAVIGPYCAFFPYDHRFDPGEKMFNQPLDSRGPIVVGPGARLGAGVTVLSGVTIGEGATVEAGSIVTRDIPPGANASGSPARVRPSRASRDGLRGNAPFPATPPHTVSTRI